MGHNVINEQCEMDLRKKTRTHPKNERNMSSEEG